MLLETKPFSSRPSSSRVGLALGGGGARGMAHIHVLHAFDDLGLKPERIAGSSIGALMAAGYAAGLDARDIEEFTLDALANRRLVMGRLWKTRPPTFAEFLAEGGLRLGQLNAERVVTAFLPLELPLHFEGLAIPLTVMATDFYAGEECRITGGDLRSAIGASAALPAIFRPVTRDGRVLIDGGITNPLPFDVFGSAVDMVVACDVTGGPVASGAALPSPVEAMFGASQLMMHAIIRAKLACGEPRVLVQPKVSTYRVLDFLRARIILSETALLREETKRRVAEAMEALERQAG